MAKIYYFNKQAQSAKDSKDVVERNKARLLIYQASFILSGLGEKEKRVSWLIEDCADLLQENASNSEPVNLHGDTDAEQAVPQ